ncbi:alpha-galactosidase [Cypionkella sp.]|uniref:alpha-galactosidase n=1 Tax=Cypionkella sp. TaxID=2811411 RepID=UPI00271F142A|nr:alpha-galactosidase [Cypionkella sp.]MDO8985220.1 alpha-galactosidase [Cypionkella sp.]MDP2051720.1 alpha-galactosidase [Cypionkella sp.]
MPQWRLDTAQQTLVMASTGAVPQVVYWGTPLPVSEDLAALALSQVSDLTGGMLDRLPDLSLCPLPGSDWQGQPGMTISEVDGRQITPRFQLERAEIAPDSLMLHSAADGLRLTHSFRAHATGVIAMTTTLHADRPVRLHWLAAPVLPIAALGTEMIDVAGKWLGEFQLQRQPWSVGARLRESRTGRSGQEHPPYALFPEPGCTNTAGTVRALHYAWSGGHRMVAEELPDGRRQVQFGHAWGSELEAATSFQSAELLAVVSDSGLNGIGRVFQRDMRDRVVTWPDPARPRPVHYNCWEAVYFDHDLATLSDIASRAASLGAERFVLDDGWFGRRDNDTSSLGDWTVDLRKWPQGLHPLIRHIHDLNMTFGLWVEPEMINANSDLYRAHPDWVLGRADQTTGRNQLVLNLGLQPVQDHLFGVLAALLREYPIDYLKWDHNRLLPVVDAAQNRGIYALMARLRAAHPLVELESCASGGGRIDAGILAHTHRVWLSDCLDPIERLRIQHDAALFLPSCLVGSHVGARRSHTTGRVQAMSLRAWVAATRHFGFEMDLRALDADEAQILGRVTAWWKSNRDWLMQAATLRLDSADPAVTAEMQLAEDGARFVLTAAQIEISRQILPKALRLTGLDPTAHYEIRLLNPEDAPPQSRARCALATGSLRLSGAALMAQGILLPVAWPATIWMIEGSVAQIV